MVANDRNVNATVNVVHPAHDFRHPYLCRAVYPSRAAQFTQAFNVSLPVHVPSVHSVLRNVQL